MGNSIAVTIPIEGGLDLVTPQYILSAQNPGAAIELVNFEPYPGGGYRRVSGYTKWSTNTPTSATTQLYGVCQYAKGIVAVQAVVGTPTNYNIYYTEDGTTWIQVNKQLTGYPGAVAAGVNSSTLAGLTQTTRTTAAKNVQFIFYEGNTDYGELFILDGSNYIGWLKIVDTGGRAYWYDEITTFASANWGTVFKDHLVVGGDPGNKETVYWSDAFLPRSFTGGTSGSIKFTDKITGVKSWRDRLFVFSQNSVSELSGINSVPTVNTISRNVGCLTGYSIQEVGGDLVWLSPDGLRNLAGTEKLDDIELGTISRKINPLIEEIINNVNVLDISSIVIREKNQYRLYYTKSTYGTDNQKGIIGTYKISSKGLQWEWAETRGIVLSCAWSGVNNVNDITSLGSMKEVLLHGDYTGHVYQHDKSDATGFNGSNISANFVTPYLDYGDEGVKKTIQWVQVNGQIEGANYGVFLRLIFDYESTLTAQPAAKLINPLQSLTYYGSGIFGTSIYNSGSYFDERILTEGSGFTNSFRIFSNNTGSPYIITGMYVRAYGGKTR